MLRRSNANNCGTDAADTLAGGTSGKEAGPLPERCALRNVGQIIVMGCDR